MSLRTKIFLSIVLLMFITTALLAANLMGEGIHQQQRNEERFDRLVSTAVESWVADTFPIDAENGSVRLSRQEIIDLVDGYVTRAEAGGGPRARLVNEIVLVDEFRFVIAQTDKASLPASFKPPIGDTRVVQLDDAALVEALRSRERRTVFDGDRAYVALSPKDRLDVRDRLGARRPAREYLLAVRLRLNMPEMEPQETRQLLMSMLGFMALGTALLVMTVYWLLYRLVVQPLEKLTGASRRIAQGDYSTLFQPRGLDDEIDSLGLAFNRMVREVQGYQVTLEDRIDQAVAQKRRAEQGLIIAQRLAATGTLAAGMAHEINNPLTGMQNAAHRLLQRLERIPDARADLRIRTYVELISEGLAQVEDIVKRVLQFSRRAFSPEPFSIRDTVERALALARHKLDRFDVHVDVVQDSDSELPRCFGERGEIEQVFLNLVINAADAIREARELPDRSPDVEDRIVVRLADSDEGIQASVTDTGKGMTEHDAAHAFDAFYTTKPGGEGTGLGLAIVHNIVDSHGGTIHIDTTLGEGTTVSFTIPKHLED